ncbi:MAG: ABC transporter substrate-binding protein [Acidimicrobiaceae bacterium]|nr:ABC transporter substrate-binding protein [Acidimicrobiaceae bacterium]
MTRVVAVACAISLGLAATFTASTGLVGAATAPHGAATRPLGASQCAANRAAGKVTYVSPFGFDASAGIIDVFAAKKLGYFADMCLNVEFVTNATDANELVSSNTAQVTNEGSAADAIEAIASGAHMVGIETAGNTSDYAIITEKSITSLKQLDGKTLGYYTILPVVLREMLRAAGAKISSIKLIADTNYNPTQVIQGTLQGLQAYQSNQVITLKSAKDSFNEFTPQQFGIRGTYNVMTVNATFLSRHRQAVTDFMRADLRALHFCINHPSACVKIEGTYAKGAGAQFVTAHEDAVWALERKLALSSSLPGKGLGVQTYAEWQPESTALGTYGVMATVPKLASAEDVSLVASLYKGKTLIWP